MKKLVLLILATTVIFSGCIPDIMKPAPVDAVFAPDSENAIVTFMRPSSFQHLERSYVCDVTEGENGKNVLIGDVLAKGKVIYKSPPGKRIFMVYGKGSADFLEAHLDPGKSYNVLILTNSFSFLFDPVNKEQYQNGKLEEWREGCATIEKADNADEWAEKNAATIEKFRKFYFKKWNEKEKVHILNYGE